MLRERSKHTSKDETVDTEDVTGESDAHIPIAPRQRSFWLMLVFACAPLYSITPLGWAYAIYSCWPLFTLPITKHVVPHPWIFSYCIFECLFSIYYQAVALAARRNKSRPAPREIQELLHLFKRILQTGLAQPISPDAPSPQFQDLDPIPTLSYDDPRAADFRAHFRLWFGGIPWNQITRRSLAKWLAWSMFDETIDALDQEQWAAIEEATTNLEKRTGGRLRDESEEDMKHPAPVIALSRDTVNVWSRPAVLYVFGDLWNRATKYYLKWKFGMFSQQFGGIEYLIRDPGHLRPVYSPVVFMHGLGFGIAQYGYSVYFLLHHLPPSQPVLVPLQPSISQAILHPLHLIPLPREQWVAGLAGLIRKLHWDEQGVTMISHSKGSLVHTWLLKAHPELIKRNCFLDPVCFCLWEGDLCWNFVYRTPSNGLELLLKYFTATEPGIALAVQRHFDWAASSLFSLAVGTHTAPPTSWAAKMQS